MPQHDVVTDWTTALEAIVRRRRRRARREWLVQFAVSLLVLVIILGAAYAGALWSAS
jgi:hypothetical protein